MTSKRRNLISLSAATAISLALAAPVHAADPAPPAAPAATQVYGLIGKIKVHPGQRDAFAAILLEGTRAMPGCHSYIIATDPKDPDALWVTEVWDSQASHRASLSLPSVKQALAKGRPMVAGFGERFETNPIGGFALP